MFGSDIFPVAAASLDMTTDFTPLLSGLYGLLGLSAGAIVAIAVSSWLLNSRRTTASPSGTTSSDIAPQERAKAA